MNDNFLSDFPVHRLCLLSYYRNTHHLSNRIQIHVGNVFSFDKHSCLFLPLNIIEYFPNTDKFVCFALVMISAYVKLYASENDSESV
jgi:hypothetical protein